MMEKITSKTELLERIKDVRAVEMLARRRYAEDTVIFKNSEITKTISDIIKDDDKVNEYDINSNKAFEEINKLILSSVNGNINENNFEIKAFQNSTTYKIILVSKDIGMQKVINKTELFFDKKDLSVIKIKIIENENDYTIISFIDKKLNETIQDNIFTIN